MLSLLVGLATGKTSTNNSPAIDDGEAAQPPVSGINVPATSRILSRRGKAAGLLL
jgi:hypothetical protein